MAAWSSRQSSSSIRTYNCVVVCRLVMCRVCAICKRRCKNNRERAQMIESPWYGDLRPVPESQSDSEDRALLIVRARHQNILKLWGLVDDTERLCAGPTFYDTPPGTFPKIWLPDGLLCVWTRLSLWNFHLWSVPQHFIPADLFQLIEVRGPRAGILCSIPTTVTHLSSEHPASTSGASLVYIPAPSPDWSGICPRTILIPFVARHQLTRQLIRSDQNLSISAWPHSIQALDDSAQLFSLHSQDGSDEFYHSLRFNNQPPFAFQIPLPILRPRLTQRQARQLESCLSFCWVFVIITITV